MQRRGERLEQDKLRELIHVQGDGAQLWEARGVYIELQRKKWETNPALQLSQVRDFPWQQKPMNFEEEYNQLTDVSIQ